MLELINMHKSFQKTKAVRGVSFCIRQGGISGLVGPKGSGKTTVMKICAGIIKADEGLMLLMNRDVNEDRNRLAKLIGYMPQIFGVYDGLKVQEYLEFYAGMYGLSGRYCYDVCMNAMDNVGIRQLAERSVDMIPREALQRLNLARCLLHHPQLLILDEPFAEMNFNDRLKMKELLFGLRKTGMTMLISSDNISELEDLCTEIVILENGRVAGSGSIDEVMKEVNVSRPLSIKIRKNMDRAIQIMKEEELVKSISISGNQLALRFNGGEEMEAKLLGRLVCEGVEVISFVREKGKMEDLMSKISNRQNGGDDL